MLMGADYACVPLLYAAGCPRYLIAPVRMSRVPTPPEALDDIDVVDEDIRKWREQVTQMQMAALREQRGGLPVAGPPQAKRSQMNVGLKGLIAAARFAAGGKRESNAGGGDGGGGQPSPDAPQPGQSFMSQASSGGLPTPGGSGARPSVAAPAGGGWGFLRGGASGGGQKSPGPLAPTAEAEQEGAGGRTEQ